MTINRAFVFWGLALVTAGVVALAAQLNYIDRASLAGAWRLWPLVLIAIGVSIILARTGLAIVGIVAAALVVGFAAGAVIAVRPGNVACGGTAPAETTERQGTFGQQATVDLRFDCGTLGVRMNNRNSWVVTSGTGAAQPRIEADKSSLMVRHQTDQWWDAGRERWIVSLPTNVNYQLTVEPNAADSHLNLANGQFVRLVLHPNAGSIGLNLTGARVDQLDLALNAGSASILVGAGADISGGTLHVNAGSVEMCVDGAAAMSFTVHDNITFSHNLDESGLGRDGDTWSYSPPVPSGAALSSIDLTIDGNAGSFTLNPEGGCA